jgi:hypothetical protein
MQRIRFFSFCVLVFVFLHLCGASSQVVPPGIVTWNLGPCALNRPIASDRLSLACYQHDVVTIWPGLSNQAVNATR